MKKTKTTDIRKKPKIAEWLEEDIKGRKTITASAFNTEVLCEQTSDEKHLDLKISEFEEQNLWRVFKILYGKRVFKDSDEQKWFDASDIRRVLHKLTGKHVPQQKVDLMLWEVDENLNKQVDETEFALMYKKCIEDRHQIEPKSLFYMVQFLMFCRGREDENGKVVDPLDFQITIAPEDTYFLIYARLDRQFDDNSKRDRLDDEIKIIFGKSDEERTAGGDEFDKEIDYNLFVQRMSKYAVTVRKEYREEQKRKLKEHPQSVTTQLKAS